MANTPNRNYPLPDTANDIDQEFFALQLTVLPMIDFDIQSLFSALDGKAPSTHGHTIDEVEGLALALEGKMPANASFTLAGLSDVVGMLAAPDGYIPVKVGDEVVFQTALSALGDHEQPISSITGLDDELEGIGTALAGKVSSTSQWFGTQAAYDAIAVPDPAVTYFIFA